MNRINLKFMAVLFLLFALLLGAGCSGTDPGPEPAPLEGQASVVREASEPSPEELSQREPELSEPKPGPEGEEIADPNAGLLVVHFLDVGQGDACFIELPSGETMLIDGGGRAASETVQEYLNKKGVNRIDHLIATHPHEDHIGGLTGVVAGYEIGKIYMPRAVHTTKTYEQLLETIKEKGLKITAARAGLEIEAGEAIEAVFVAPCNDDYDNLNDYSAVLKLTYGATSFLFTGDAEKQAEMEMVASGADLKAQVLKVGHHGSNTSTSPEFLEAVSPEIAVISAGAGNTYGHPHEEVMDRLAFRGVEIYRTDLMGHVVIIVDETKIISILTSADYLNGG